MDKPRVVVAINYGTSRKHWGEPSKATLTVFKAACDWLNQSGDVADIFACCTPDIPDMGMVPEEAKRWISRLLDETLTRQVPRVMVPATNSITEARNIRDALKRQGIEPREIIIFCDRWHAMRLRMIWPHYFPTSHIVFKTDRYVRGDDYIQLLLRREMTAAGVNVVGLFMMKIFGIERLANFKEP